MERENRALQRCIFVTAAFLLFLIFASTVRANGEQSVDWQRAKELFRKEQRGGTLTKEEIAYLERAKQLRREHARQTRTQGEVAGSKETTGLIPITEMAKGWYKGQGGGLYGEGRNTPPDSHQAAAVKELVKIQPLDAEGKPSKTGKIVLISLGMSNTTQEFSFFKNLADGVNRRKSDELVWKLEDLAGDGTHPSMTGRRKVAEMLLRFFKTDPNATTWFLKKPS